MGPAAGLGPADAQNPAILDDDAADGRIFSRGAKRPAAQAQGIVHPAPVGVHDGLAFALVAGEFADQFFEVLGFAEILVDRGKAHIGHIIEHLEGLHDELADGFRLDLAFAEAFQAADDAGHHALDPLGLDRALAQRNLDRAHELVAVKGNPPAGFLDHHEFAQLHALEGGEAAGAIGAIAPAADGGAIFAGALNPSPGFLHCCRMGSAWLPLAE